MTLTCIGYRFETHDWTTGLVHRVCERCGWIQYAFTRTTRNRKSWVWYFHGFAEGDAYAA